TGPTGSGKSTTLYAALGVLNDGERSILTIEDPVEQRIAGIKQMQIAPKAGVTFDSGLRSMLRADPDVIMVGEIRDRETAHIAVYRGGVGVYEVRTVSERIRALILERASVDAMVSVAVGEGMRRLREDGLEKVREGVTSIAEIERMTSSLL